MACMNLALPCCTPVPNTHALTHMSPGTWDFHLDQDTADELNNDVKASRVSADLRLVFV